MPALMADAVALREHLREEVPATLPQIVSGQLGLLPDAADERVAKCLELAGRAALSVAGVEQGMGPEARFHLVRQGRGPRHEAVVGVVGAPLHHLDAVEVSGNST